MNEVFIGEQMMLSDNLKEFARFFVLVSVLLGCASAYGARYEAEQAAQINDAAVENIDGFSGGQGVYFDQTGEIIWQVNAPTAGRFNVRVGGQAPWGEKMQTLSLAGQSESLMFPSSDLVTIQSTQLDFQAGVNNITLSANWGWMNIDFLEVDFPQGGNAQGIFSEAAGNAPGFQINGAWGGASFFESDQPSPNSGDGSRVLTFNTQQQWDGAPITFNAQGQQASTLRLKSMSNNSDLELFAQVGNGTDFQNFTIAGGVAGQWRTYEFNVSAINPGSVNSITFKQSSNSLNATAYIDQIEWVGDDAGNDEIVAIDAPGTIEPNGTFEVNVQVNVTEARRLVVSLKNPDGWVWHGETGVDANTSGWVTVAVTVEGSPADGDYVWEARLLTLQ